MPWSLAATFANERRERADLTRVLPARQKLMGLKDAAGKPAGDALRICELRPIKQVRAPIQQAQTL